MDPRSLSSIHGVSRTPSLDGLVDDDEIRIFGRTPCVDIPHLAPEEIVLEDPLSVIWHPDKNKNVWKSHLHGNLVVFKGEWNTQEWAPYIARESHMGHQIDGVPHTVQILGWVNGAPCNYEDMFHSKKKLSQPDEWGYPKWDLSVLNDRYGNLDRPVPCIGGLVSQHSPKTPILRLGPFFYPLATKKYFDREGINVVSSVATQLAEYHIGCLDRGVIDSDANVRDILFSGVELTKIDYDGLEWCSDRERGWDTEVVARKFEYAMLRLFLVHPLVQLRYRFENADPNYMPSELRKLLGDDGQSFLGEYSPQFALLVKDYAAGHFKTPGRNIHHGEGVPTAQEFRSFVERWTQSMVEFGERIVSSHTVRGKLDKIYLRDWRPVQGSTYPSLASRDGHISLTRD